MRARDIMTRPVVCVRPDSTLTHAAVLLHDNGFAALPVVDADQRVVGIIGETDVIARRLRSGDGRAAVVAEAMTAPVFVLHPDETVAEVARQLLGRGLRSAPIVAAGVVVGVVSRRDVMRALAHEDNTVAAQVRYRLTDYFGQGRRFDVEADDGVVIVRGDFLDQAEQGMVRALAHIVPGVREVEPRPLGPAIVRG
ncbi:CBS domain-containing protein [Solihabitans fulvus]|uniref:CBS domain-containing protein n=1 Tax=Solihabitans fulvus TaxID=1892852 RepID=A0A5B2XGF0_9PSEU|nr:CBS domain-containing protein [Solihabitans fulvus]KAA2261842.1 CBS domain-containing protein [Solihabitans fulvus]